ncbi:MAG: addiction module antidote protein [Roseiarcus sp.]
MTLKTLPFDAADALDSPEEQAALLEEAFGSGDPRVVTGALGMIARARGIGKVALEIGLSREALYKATGPDGNPTLTTLMGILRATGLKLSAKTASG